MTRGTRRGFVGLATLLATAVVATACGSSSSSSSSSATSSSGGSSTPATSTPAATSGSGGAGSQAVTDYLKYVGGKPGKADSSLSPVYIGWINQQGGQQQIGPLATSGAELAVKYINAQLGGVDGHPVALKTCFIRSPPESSR